MDPASKSIISQNLVHIKSTLSHLDPIIDRLIEGGIFGFGDRSRIEAVSAPQQQFNNFINILVTSSNPNAFRVFRKALKSEGYGTVADKLDKTTPVQSVPWIASSRLSTRENSITSNKGDIDAAAASGIDSPRNGCMNDCMTGGVVVEKVLESVERNQQAFLAELQRMRDEDWTKMEEQRRRDKDEMQRQFETLKNSNEQEYDVARISMRYVALQVKYDHLREVQKGMRQVDSERREKLMTLNRELVLLKQNYEEMEKEMKILKELLGNVAIEKEVENITQPGENTKIIENLKADKRDLMQKLDEKLTEIANLQEQIAQQAELIKNSNSGQDNTRSNKDIAREEKIDKMYEMMEKMVKEKTEVADDIKEYEDRKKAHTGLNTSRIQLNERHAARNKITGTKALKLQLNTDRK
ncbi:uncharacterized protein [Argopecten irradians]|uniref:uncharacterized protein n=1 Tax=Argopecten irradians TaxID=31199 RepID=UPI0037136FBC